MKKNIRYQNDLLKINENSAVRRMETRMKLPAKAASSKIMRILTVTNQPETTTTS